MARRRFDSVKFLILSTTMVTKSLNEESINPRFTLNPVQD